MTPAASRLDAHVGAVFQPEPVERVVEDAPDDVFLNTSALVGAVLLVQVNRSRASSHFDDELRGALDIALGVQSRAAWFLAPQAGVWLHFGVRVQQHGAVVAPPDLGMAGTVRAEPASNPHMGARVKVGHAWAPRRRLLQLAPPS